MVNLLRKSWFDRHPLEEYSAARIQYSMMLHEGIEELTARVIREKGLENPQMAQHAQSIANEEDLKELLRWMKRIIHGQGALVLREKLLKREEEALPESSGCC